MAQSVPHAANSDSREWALLSEQARRSASDAFDSLGQLRDSVPPAQWLALAARLAESLRQRGELDVALAVARSGERRTLRLRVEELLCVCALGDTKTARQLLAAEPKLEPLLGPVVQALDGVPGLTLPRGVKSAAAKQLHAACRAVCLLAAQRSTEALQSARHAGGEFFEPCLRLLVDLQRGNVPPTVAATLCFDAEGVRKRPSLGRSLCHELSRRGLVLNLDSAPLKASAGALWNELLKSQLNAAKHDARRLAGVLRHWNDAEVPRGSVLSYGLWRAYTELRLQPERASKRLTTLAASCAEDQRTLRLEALRGVYRGAMEAIRRARPDVAKAQAFERAARRLFDGFESTGLRLEAAVLSVHAVEVLLGILGPYSDAQAIQSWLSRAKWLVARLGADAPRAERALACAEAGSLLSTAPERSLALASDVVAQDPKNARAWEVRIEAARRTKHPEVNDWLIAAFAATEDARFQAEARRVTWSRGDAPAFSSLGMGEVSAGQLLVEMCRFLDHPPAEFEGRVAAASSRDFEVLWAAALERALPFAAKLSRDQRLAFDAATVAAALARSGEAAAAQMFTRCWNNRDDDAGTATLLGVLLECAKIADGPEAELPRAALLLEALFDAPDVTAAVPRFLRALALLGRYEWANRLLLESSARMSVQTLKACQYLLSPRPPLEAEPGEAWSFAHDQLHPELCLTRLTTPTVHFDDFVNDPNGDDTADAESELEDFEYEADLDDALDELGWFGKLIKLDLPKAKALSLERKQALLDALDDIAPNDVTAARRLVERFGVVKTSASQAPSFKPTTSQDKNKLKRQRKQRKQGKGKGKGSK